MGAACDLAGSPVSAPSDRQPLTTYNDWAAALAAWFFRPEYARSHVMFLVDDAALGAVYGGEPSDAVSRLIAATRPKLRSHMPRQLFSDIERSTRRWKLSGGDGPPPCLPLLAITVLAATRMARGADRAGHNYYLPFIELLDLEVDEHDVISSYGETIPDLWKMLQWWLDERHAGELGLSTIVSDSHFTRIGFADSQTLFHASDNDKLTRFLKWLGLAPGEQIGDEELLAYFRLWAARSKADLTLGAQAMLEEGDSPRQLVEILRRCADSWHGVVRDDRGRAEASILITLRTFPRPELGLVAEKPPSFPAALAVQHVDDEVELISDDPEDERAAGWYRIPFPLTGPALLDGITLTADGRALRLAPALLHVLHKHPELGSWASTPRLRPGEPAWLLVSDEITNQVEEFVSNNARPPTAAARWSWVDRPGSAPPGWRLMRDVIVDPGPIESGDGLDALRPRFQIRLSIRGGLPLQRGSDVYLTGGEPDLWLPEGENLAHLDVTVDGIDRSGTGDMLHLCQLDLAEGPHEVGVGSISRAFATQRSTGDIAPTVGHRIGHAVARGQLGITARTLDATAVGGESDEVVVVGATILGDAADGQTAGGKAVSERPVVLPVNAKAFILLGAVPGQITWVPRVPDKPGWMAIADLTYRVFEFLPRFQVVWVLTEWRLSPTERGRLRDALPPAAIPTVISDPVKKWATTMLEWHPPSDPIANALWGEYMDIAELILEA
jgi:hypothetical protein